MLSLLKHEVNIRDSIFQGIWRWPVTILVILIHGYPHLFSLKIFIASWKLRSFQEIKVNLNGLLEILDTTYLSRNSLNGILLAKLRRNYSVDLGLC